MLALEAAFNARPSKPWREIIVDPKLGETEEAVMAREGIGPDDNVIVRVIVDPRVIEHDDA